MGGWPVGYSLSRRDAIQGPERKPRERSGLCHTEGWMMIDDANPLVDNTGLVTGVAAGSTKLTAALFGVSCQDTVTVA